MVRVRRGGAQPASTARGAGLNRTGSGVSGAQPVPLGLQFGQGPGQETRGEWVCRCDRPSGGAEQDRGDGSGGGFRIVAKGCGEGVVEPEGGEAVDE